MRPNAPDEPRRARDLQTVQGPHGPASGPLRQGSGHCIDAAQRPRLLLYALSSCGDEEASVFEAHLLACEACFQDLVVLDRAGSLIRELAASRSPVRVRVNEALRHLRPHEGIASPPPQHRI